jgi:succinylglutamate desuccinylase
MTIKALLISGEFLHLSRTQPDLFQDTLSIELFNKTQMEIIAPGIVSFSPEHFGAKDIVLSCGVHGNETAPIEICDKLVKQIITGELSLAHRVLFLFGNLPAMDIGERFIDENMNRLFSGAHSEPVDANTPERLRAKQLEFEVERFYSFVEGSVDESQQRERFHYDLHTAIRASKNEKFAVYPFLHGKPHSKEQLQFLLASGVKTILLSESSTTTFSYFSSHRFGAHAFTVELGKVKPFGQNDMSQFAQAVDSLTQLLTVVRLDLPHYNEDDFLLYRVNQVINKSTDDFSLNFADDEPNFTDYPKGHLLAQDSGKQYRAEYDGEAIVFPNAQVAIGQRALLTVVPTRLNL